MAIVKPTQEQKHIVNHFDIFKDVIKLYEEEEISREYPTFIQGKG